MDWFEKLIPARAGETSHDFIFRVVGTMVLLCLYALVVRAIRRISARTVDDARSRWLVMKAAGYGFGALTLFLLVRIWVQEASGVFTYLGLVSAGVALALQDPIIDLAGWLFLVMRRPFAAGDRIQIGSHIGDVVDIRLFQFTLLEVGHWINADQPTGRVIFIPNGWIFKNSIANYDRGFRYIWNEIEVVITFESQWRKAKELLQSILSEHAAHLATDVEKEAASAEENYHVRFSSLEPTVWTGTTESGVKLTLRYLCKPRERRASEHELWEAVLDSFAEHDDIDLAYPTKRVFDNVAEGKKGARAQPS